MPDKDKNAAEEQDTQAAAEAGPAEETVVAGIEAPHVATQGLGNTEQILPPSGAPGAQMVKVKEVASGRVFGAWPVDARELVTHPDAGHVYAEADEPMTPPRYTTSGNPVPVAPASGTSPVAITPVAPESAPAGTSPANPLGAVDPLTATAQLSDLSKSELQGLAGRAGVDQNQTKQALVEQLQPHVSAGTINLGGAGGVGLPPSGGSR